MVFSFKTRQWAFDIQFIVKRVWHAPGRTSPVCRGLSSMGTSAAPPPPRRQIKKKENQCAFQDICHGNTLAVGPYEPTPRCLVHKKLASANQNMDRERERQRERDLRRTKCSSLVSQSRVCGLRNRRTHLLEAFNAMVIWFVVWG